MANKRRVFKVAEKARMVLANELFRVSDPRFNLVTITSVVVSPDLRNIKAYWMVSGDVARRNEVAAAFEGATGLFKRVLADELSTRFAPDIRFYYDDTLDTTENVERLLAIARSRDNGETV